MPSHADGAVVWLLTVLLSLLACFLSRRHPAFQSTLILLSSFLLGCALINVAERNHAVQLPEGKTRYAAVVASEPTGRGKIIRFDMLIASGPLRGRTVRASLLKDTVGQRYRRLEVGSGLTVYSEIKTPENFGNSAFDYVTYLKVHGVVAQTFIYYSDWSESPVCLGEVSPWQRARLSFIRLRHRLIDQYRALGLTDESLAVAAAMTLGHRTDISSELRDAYSAAGVSHVLALSGMHLSVIYLLLSFLCFGRRFAVLRETLLVVSIWGYVVMVGMSSSVIRSAIMITVYSIVGLTGRDRMSLNALAFAALLMLVASPFSLYDVGFQLSFLAVAGILILHRPVSGLIPGRVQQRFPLFRWLWQLVVMSCSAQIATAPLVAYYFGNVPVCFLLSNLVAVPAVTIILYLSILTLVLFFIPFAQQMAATLLMLVVTLLNTFLLWVASLPGAAVTGLHLNILQLIAAYILIVSLCLISRLMLRRFRQNIQKI